MANASALAMRKPAAASAKVTANCTASERATLPTRGARAGDGHVVDDAGGPAGQHDHAVGHGHRFRNRVRDHEHGLQPRLPALPDAEQFLVEHLARELVERAERLAP